MVAKFIIKAVNTKGQPLNGVVFTSKIAGGVEAPVTYTTDSSGIASFTTGSLSKLNKQNINGHIYQPYVVSSLPYKDFTYIEKTTGDLIDVTATKFPPIYSLANIAIDPPPTGSQTPDGTYTITFTFKQVMKYFTFQVEEREVKYVSTGNNSLPQLTVGGPVNSFTLKGTSLTFKYKGFKTWISDEFGFHPSYDTAVTVHPDSNGIFNVKMLVPYDFLGNKFTTSYWKEGLTYDALIGGNGAIYFNYDSIHLPADGSMAIFRYINGKLYLLVANSTKTYCQGKGLWNPSTFECEKCPSDKPNLSVECNTCYAPCPDGYYFNDIQCRCVPMKTITYEAIDSSGKLLTGIKFVILGKTYTTNTNGTLSAKVGTSNPFTNSESIVSKVYDPSGKYIDFKYLKTANGIVIYQGKSKEEPKPSKLNYTNVTIVVKDTDGNPVSGIHVWSDSFPDKYTCVTGKDGTCTLKNVPIAIPNENVPSGYSKVYHIHLQTQNDCYTLTPLTSTVITQANQTVRWVAKKIQSQIPTPPKVEVIDGTYIGVDITVDATNDAGSLSKREVYISDDGKTWKYYGESTHISLPPNTGVYIKARLVNACGESGFSNVVYGKSTNTPPPFSRPAMWVTFKAINTKTSQPLAGVLVSYPAGHAQFGRTNAQGILKVYVAEGQPFSFSANGYTISPSSYVANPKEPTVVLHCTPITKPSTKTIVYEAIDSSGKPLAGIKFVILGMTYTTNTSGTLSVKITTSDNPENIVSKVFDPSGKYVDFKYLKTVNGMVVYQGKLAIPSCGPHASWDGSQCVCDSGYHKDSSGNCVQNETSKTVVYEAVDQNKTPLAGIDFIISGKTYTTDSNGEITVELPSNVCSTCAVSKVYDPTGKYIDFVVLTKTKTDVLKVIYQGKLAKSMTKPVTTPTTTKNIAAPTSDSTMLLVGAAVVLGILLLNRRK